MRNPPESPSLKYSQEFHIFPASSVSTTPWNRAWIYFWQGRSLKSATQSCFETLLGDYFLLFYRLVCFGYFFGVIFVWGYVDTKGANAFYFTLWNIDLVTLYYLLATIASTSRLYLTTFHPSTEVTPAYLVVLSNTTQVIFEFAAATAFFVTLVAFTALDPHFAFWNVNQHFVTSMSFLGELALNKMGAR
ncbi:hypothetical protein EON65_22885 [archaeon]|nr:MAG: hypothetical protein EON65_22885 [archaeon]